MTARNKVGAGLGVAAAAVAAVAGAYFLYGKLDKKKKKKIQSWVLKAKAEVLERLEGMKEVSQETYEALIDKVAAKYEQAKHVDKKELTAMVDDMKKHWKAIQKSLKS
ncbi:MAG: hypothetical protein A2542_01640 [Parcubacteria group bacterium RIFOXYD2_FULL_52_8]|nr:MAG: hypothetical protein A2542_01640 [Parcubacteria group bacterium RIFOXYD2_FULL_52_8]